MFAKLHRNRVLTAAGPLGSHLVLFSALCFEKGPCMPALSRCACALTPEGAASRVQAHARDLQELSMRGRVSRGAVFESDGCRETCVTSTAYDACRTNCRAVQLATRISMDWCTLAVGVPNLSDVTEGNTPHARLFRASSFFGSQGFGLGRIWALRVQVGRVAGSGVIRFCA